MTWALFRERFKDAVLGAVVSGYDVVWGDAPEGGSWSPETTVVLNTGNPTQIGQTVEQYTSEGANLVLTLWSLYVVQVNFTLESQSVSGGFATAENPFDVLRKRLTSTRIQALFEQANASVLNVAPSVERIDREIDGRPLRVETFAATFQVLVPLRETSEDTSEDFFTRVEYSGNPST